jgi:GTP cyclohydrolase I
MKSDRVALPTPTEQMQDVLESFGMDCSRNPSTKDTPRRFIKYLEEFFQPFLIKDIMGDGFEVPDEGSIGGMIIQSHIPFVAICEHHLVPFWGEAFIGYIPGKRIVGLSKMARLVEAVGHEKPGIQEAMTERIADVMFSHLESKGSIVVIKAVHTCMSCRGVRAIGASTTTSCLRGLFLVVPAAREEFLSLAGINNK